MMSALIKNYLGQEINQDIETFQCSKTCYFFYQNKGKTGTSLVFVRKKRWDSACRFDDQCRVVP